MQPTQPGETEGSAKLQNKPEQNMPENTSDKTEVEKYFQDRLLAEIQHLAPQVNTEKQLGGVRGLSELQRAGWGGTLLEDQLPACCIFPVSDFLVQGSSEGQDREELDRPTEPVSSVSITSCEQTTPTNSTALTTKFSGFSSQVSASPADYTK